jgi:hypothetical protein
MVDLNTGMTPLLVMQKHVTHSALQVATTIDSQVYVKGNFTPDAGGNAARVTYPRIHQEQSELVDGDYGKHR